MRTVGKVDSRIKYGTTFNQTRNGKTRPMVNVYKSGRCVGTIKSYHKRPDARDSRVGVNYANSAEQEHGFSKMRAICRTMGIGKQGEGVVV